MFCVDDEHNATGSLEETHSIASHGDAFVVQNARAHPKLTDHQLTDRSAQHGAKRPPRTEIVGSLSHAQASEKRGRDRRSVPTVAPCSYAGGKLRLSAGLALDTTGRSQQRPRQRSLGTRNSDDTPLSGCFVRALRLHKASACLGALTFDMRGGRKQAKLACGRPLDGRVRDRWMADRWFTRVHRPPLP